MKLKKIAGMVLASFMVVGLALPTSAAARTSTDQFYEFSISMTQQGVSASAPKDDYTSSYIYFRGGTAYSASYMILSYPGYVNCTERGSVLLARGAKVFVRNDVKESGYNRAVLWAGGKTSESTKASGYWSPDSVYESGIPEV